MRYVIWEFLHLYCKRQKIIYLFVFWNNKKNYRKFFAIIQTDFILQEIFRARIVMCLFNNKQKYCYENCTSIVVLYNIMTSFNINLELFEKYQTLISILHVIGKN